MEFEQLKSIKEALLEERAALTWSELKQAFLQLWKLQEKTQKSLDEANSALSDAIADDITSNQLI